MTDIELMMENGTMKVLYFCQDCPKRRECDKRFSPCCDNFLGYRLTVKEKDEALSSAGSEDKG